MKKIYYEKVGRRYAPVSEYDSDFLDSFTKGTHLVMSYPGGKSICYNINPNYAAMIAAGRVAEDAICMALRHASEARPKSSPITERQRAAWEEMKAAFGDEFYSLTIPCSRDLAEAATKALTQEAEKLMTNPAVKLAYDHFIMVCQLTANNNVVE
jgi:hypothetical protein